MGRRASRQHDAAAVRLPIGSRARSRPRIHDESIMFQVRIHGRGGQGVVSGAELLSVAAFLEGRYAQAFPSFGSERMGAPVMAFCRIDDKEIRLREPVLDARRADHPGRDAAASGRPLQGPCGGGYILLNSTRSFDELGLGEFARGSQHYPAVPRARDRARDQARRAPGAQCRAARRLCRDQRRSRSSRWSPQSARSFRTRSPRRTSPPRPRRTSSRQSRRRPSMLKQTKDRAPWRRRSRSAGRR